MLAHKVKTHWATGLSVCQQAEAFELMRVGDFWVTNWSPPARGKLASAPQNTCAMPSGRHQGRSNWTDRRPGQTGPEPTTLNQAQWKAPPAGRTGPTPARANWLQTPHVH